MNRITQRCLRPAVLGVLAIGLLAHVAPAAAQALPLGGGPAPDTTTSQTTRTSVHHKHTTTTETTKVTRQTSGHTTHHVVVHTTTTRTEHPHHSVVKETTTVVRHDSHAPPHHPPAHRVVPAHPLDRGGSYLGVPTPPHHAAPRPEPRPVRPAPHVAPHVVPHVMPHVPPGPPPPAPVAPPPPAPPPDPAKGSATGLPLPRYAALRSDQVNWRAGPGTRYPIDWIYQRRDLPVRIEREFEVWRLVAESDGTKGWVHQATLTGRRSFVIAGAASQTLRAAANDTAPPVAILKPGVVGQIRSCATGSDWCAVEVKSYKGYLNRTSFWGTLPGEAVGP